MIEYSKPVILKVCIYRENYLGFYLKNSWVPRDSTKVIELLRRVKFCVILITWEWGWFGDIAYSLIILFEWSLKYRKKIFVSYNISEVKFLTRIEYKVIVKKKKPKKYGVLRDQKKFGNLDTERYTINASKKRKKTIYLSNVLLRYVSLRNVKAIINR